MPLSVTRIVTLSPLAAPAENAAEIVTRPAGRCVLDAVVEEVDHLSDSALDRRNGRRLRELGVELDVLRSPSVWKK